MNLSSANYTSNSEDSYKYSFQRNNTRYFAKKQDNFLKIMSFKRRSTLRGVIKDHHEKKSINNDFKTPYRKYNKRQKLELL